MSEETQAPEFQGAIEPILRLIERWQWSFPLFVEEGLGIDGTRGYKMSTQQRDGAEKISKMVNAKRKKNVFEEQLTEEEETYCSKVGISIMSGQGPGKDGLLAWFIIWFLFCFREVLIPMTAPGMDQLKNILVAEITRWLNRNDKDGRPLVLPFIKDAITVQTDKVYNTEFGGKINFAFAKTANPKDDAEAQAKTLYGLHEKYMCIVCEEAAGIPEPVFKPLEGTLTREVNFLFLVFNPIYRTGFAIDSHLGKHMDRWIALQWDAEESEIVNPQHIKDMEEKYGRNSNTFRTLVKGLPPLAEADTLIPYDWVMDATKRELDPAEEDPKMGGLDPGAGGDNSVFTYRQGPVLQKQWSHSSPDTMQTAMWACGLYDECKLDVLFVDIIGIGKGVYDRMKELGYNVMPVDSRAKAMDDLRYENKRAELWWNARHIFEIGGIQIPNDDELKAELWSPKMKKTSHKKDSVESKYDMKKRLAGGRSPNKADSLLLTFAYPDSVFRKITDAYEDEDEYYERKRKKRPPEPGRRSWMRI